MRSAQPSFFHGWVRTPAAHFIISFAFFVFSRRLFAKRFHTAFILAYPILSNSSSLTRLDRPKHMPYEKVFSESNSKVADRGGDAMLPHRGSGPGSIGPPHARGPGSMGPAPCSRAPGAWGRPHALSVGLLDTVRDGGLHVGAKLFRNSISPRLLVCCHRSGAKNCGKEPKFNADGNWW